MPASCTARNIPSKRWDIEDKIAPLNVSKGCSKKSAPAKSTPAKTLKKRRTKKEITEDQRLKKIVEDALQGNIDPFDSSKLC
jgi:hypothetical protein